MNHLSTDDIERIRTMVSKFLESGVKVGGASDDLLRALAMARFPIDSKGKWVDDPTISDLRERLNFKNDMQLSRLLKEARQRGLVRVVFDEEAPSAHKSLRSRYSHLKVIESVPTVPNYKQLLPKIGELAAQVFDRICFSKHPKRLAIGGGMSMRQFVNHLEKRSRSLVITPTNLATRSPVAEVYDSSYLAAVTHWNCQELSHAIICSLPPFPEEESKDNYAYAKTMHRELLKHNSTVQKVFRESLSPDVAFIGAVHFHENSLTLERAYRRVGLTYEMISKSGAIGDMNFNLFDRDGNDLTPGLASKHLGIKTLFDPRSHPFIVGLNLAHFKKLSSDEDRDIILVCGGDHKIPVMRALIHGRIVNGIITDEQSLIRLTEED